MARISEVKGEAVIDIIADIIEPVANIATDPKMQDIIRKENVAEGTDVRALAIERLKRNVPKLIKNHKQDVIAILAALEGADPKAYAKELTLAVLIRDVTEVFGDPELVGFFTSQAVLAANEDTDSESTSTTSNPALALA